MEMILSEIWSIIQTGQTNAILLKPKGIEAAVPITIGALEMKSILIGKQSKKLPRPLTHDLLLNLFSTLNLSLQKVELYDIKDDIYHSRLIITGGEYTNEKPFVLDCRPSDAIALNTRKRFPIYIAVSVIEQAAVPLDYFIEPPEEIPQTRHSELIEHLQHAIETEDYETAAKIRDIIKKLED
jgi:bifunctional DNase/RNase